MRMLSLTFLTLMDVGAALEQFLGGAAAADDSGAPSEAPAPARPQI